MTIKDEINTLFEYLKNNRRNFYYLWQDISRNILHVPMCPENVDKKDFDIDLYQTSIAGLTASDIYATGVSSNLTPSIEQWFRYTDPNVTNASDTNIIIQNWYDKVSDLVFSLFDKNDLYTNLHKCYLDSAVFGLGTLFLHKTNDDKFFKFEHLPVGTYYIDKDVIFVERVTTVNEFVNEYGIDAVGKRIKRLYDNNKLIEKVCYVQCVYPNKNYKPSSDNVKEYKYKFVIAVSDNFNVLNQNSDFSIDDIVFESGLKMFPALVFKWENVDAYPTKSAGALSLGSKKSIEKINESIFSMLENATKPSIFTGQGVVIDNMTDQNNFEYGKIYTTKSDLKDNLQIINAQQVGLREGTEFVKQLESQISKLFHSDIFLLITESITRQTTAFETNQRLQEKLTLLSSIIQIYENELRYLNEWVFNVLLDREVFNSGSYAGNLVQPKNKNFVPKVTFTSKLALLQRRSVLSNIKEFLDLVLSYAQALPSMLYIIDPILLSFGIANSLGVPTKYLIDTNTAKKTQQQQQQAQAQQQQFMQQLEIAKVQAKSNNNQQGGQQSGSNTTSQ